MFPFNSNSPSSPGEGGGEHVPVAGGVGLPEGPLRGGRQPLRAGRHGAEILLRDRDGPGRHRRRGMKHEHARIRGVQTG